MSALSRQPPSPLAIQVRVPFRPLTPVPRGVALSQSGVNLDQPAPQERTVRKMQDLRDQRAAAVARKETYKAAFDEVIEVIPTLVRAVAKLMEQHKFLTLGEHLTESDLVLLRTYSRDASSLDLCNFVAALATSASRLTHYVRDEYTDSIQDNVTNAGDTPKIPTLDIDELLLASRDE